MRKRPTSTCCDASRRTRLLAQIRDDVEESRCELRVAVTRHIDTVGTRSCVRTRTRATDAGLSIDWESVGRVWIVERRILPSGAHREPPKRERRPRQSDSPCVTGKSNCIWRTSFRARVSSYPRRRGDAYANRIPHAHLQSAYAFWQRVWKWQFTVASPVDVIPRDGLRARRKEPTLGNVPLRMLREIQTIRQTQETWVDIWSVLELSSHLAKLFD